MKKTLITLIFIIPHIAIAQEINSIYEFTNPVYFSSGANLKSNSDTNLQFKKGHKITVIDTINGHVYFTYLKFGKGKNSKTLNENYYYSEKAKSNKFNLNNDGNEDLRDIQIHSLSKSKFNTYTSKFYSRFKGVTAGIFTVPFKLRVDDFDFEQNVNIGMNLGFPFRINRRLENKWLLSPTIGIGLSTVTLNPKNSSLEESEDGEDANRTASAFSISGGLLLQFTDSINIGFQIGFDHLGNNDKGINWKYDRKAWIGIGINIGVSISDSKTSDKKKQK